MIRVLSTYEFMLILSYVSKIQYLCNRVVFLKIRIHFISNLVPGGPLFKKLLELQRKSLDMCRDTVHGGGGAFSLFDLQPLLKE